MGIGNFSFPLKGADPFQVRGELGRFISGPAQAEARAANQRIAESTIGFVARAMENQFKRPAVSTGNLLRATLHPKNIYATAFKVGIGDPDVLARQGAKYWRTIEEGTAATWKKRPFTSLELLGFFGATISGRHAGPTFTLPGQATGGKFRPVVPREDEDGNLVGHMRQGGRTIELRPFHPRHEVEGIHAYKQAFESGGMPESGVFAYRKLIQRIFREIVHTPAG